MKPSFEYKPFTPFLEAIIGKLSGGDIAESLEGIVKFFGVMHERPSFFAHARDSRNIQQRIVARLGGVGPASISNRIRSPLLGWRVV